MLAIETVFLAILAVMAIRIMQARLSAINSYSLWVLAILHPIDFRERQVIRHLLG